MSTSLTGVFVSNVKTGTALRDVIKLVEQTNHSTVIITEDGTANGKFIGIVTDKDYRITRVDLDTPVDMYMVPKDKVICGKKGITLSSNSSK